ncbi:hypothetical protein A5717_26160 [Mycolicibacterium porcinum]|uniref:DUF5131 family protein n=1 Tax=Mycolicibacterium porcinum TaxID=39693 RepID=UPI00080B1BEF|nr:phage Gp37/Gp68 family protein [Mycolicibacterium porcinum]OCB09262.1 hypothetical protein A5717_26160 [Mycolicibacterium porcinum]
MSDNTSIEWCDSTWNPVTGCTEVSPGCDHCYAKTFAERWRGTPGHYFEHGFDVQLRPDKLDQPLRWTRPRRIFVNSMSDLFHDDVPDEYIAKVWAVMALAPQHTFQVLTKRHARMRSLLNNNAFLTRVCEYGEWFALTQKPNRLDDRIFRRGPWPLPNVWLGVSTESQQWADIRIPALLDAPAAVRFISAEPLLGPIDLIGQGGNMVGAGIYSLPDPPEYDGGEPVCQDHGVEQCQQGCTFLDWVIVGGESGPGARPMHPDWARSLRDQCTAAGVPFLFKQWGEYRPNQRGVRGYSTDRDRFVFLDGSGHMALRDMAESMSGPRFGTTVKRVGKKQAGRVLDGRTWDEYPDKVTHGAAQHA